MITAKLSNEELSALRTVWYNVGVVGETPERETLVKHGYLIRTHKKPAHYEMSEDGLCHFRMLEVNHVEKLEVEITQLRKQFTDTMIRALKAETEWATFRQLAETAQGIVAHDYPLDGSSKPAHVREFLQRCESALKAPALDSEVE